MLALKKKREAEAKAKAEAEAAAKANGTATVQAPADSNKVSLLGIGGKKKKANDGNGASGKKKRTPGEIRIQKGELDWETTQGLRSSQSQCCKRNINLLGCHWDMVVPGNLRAIEVTDPINNGEFRRLSIQ
mmetsp:Transcript_33239/g.79406  ORF Transcript_33239/g.79406 Transcript_33239/m.79406 type:complete len:131 (+) Transcript_33239:147-539(+)